MEPVTNDLGLYVHWPYCSRICPYCDFNIYKNKTIDETAWSAALIADLTFWAERTLKRPLRSIYFGGGTPSLAPPDVIGAVIEKAASLFGLEADAELTLEANPTDADPKRFQAFRDIGINRLSLGVQSFRDDALAFLGRDHGGEEARRAIDLAQQLFPDVSFDLIFGLPGQSPERWRDELREGLALGPNHLSLYQLTIEPGTAFAKAVKAGRWQPPDDTLTATQYDIARQETADAGLIQYEVSNYARPGHESRHNLIYWQYQDYIGIGPGAHGRLTWQNTRYATKAPDRPDIYLKGSGRSRDPGNGIEALDQNAQLIERLAMGLRLKDGIPLYADDYFYTDDARVASLSRLIADGFLSHHCGTLRATEKGQPLLNRVLYELLG